MLLHGGAESQEVSQSNRLHELQVGQHRHARVRVAEDGAVGDLSQQQLDDGTELRKQGGQGGVGVLLATGRVLGLPHARGVLAGRA